MLNGEWILGGDGGGHKEYQGHQIRVLVLCINLDEKSSWPKLSGGNGDVQEWEN